MTPEPTMALVPKSPRTTVAGIAAIVAAIAGAASAWANGQPVDYASALAAIMAGIGLITARDANVSSEQQGIKPEGK